MMTHIARTLLSVTLIGLFLGMTHTQARGQDEYWEEKWQELDQRMEGREELDLRDKQLDKEHVAWTDSEFYRRYPKLAGRPLPMNPDNAEYRRKWMNLYLNPVVGPELDFPEKPAVDPTSFTPGGWVANIASTVVTAGAEKIYDSIYSPPAKTAQRKVDDMSIEHHISRLKPNEKGKWQELNAAIDDFLAEKNAPADTVSNMYNLENEKTALGEVMESIDAENMMDARKIEQQLIELSRLQGEIAYMDEQASRTINTIEELQSRKQDLERKQGQVTESLNATGPENERLEDEIDLLSESIAAEQARLASLQAQRISAGSGLQTLTGALSQAGNIPPADNLMRGRSKVFEDTWTYKGETAYGSYTIHADPNRINFDAQSRGGDYHWKKTFYRKELNRQ
ncbi:MAG: hypothetical protein GY850_19510 [bacterium]|nr:hypothetical protein [bacterium]